MTHVECKDKTETSNNTRNWNHPNFILKIPK